LDHRHTTLPRRAALYPSLTVSFLLTSTFPSRKILFLAILDNTEQYMKALYRRIAKVKTRRWS